MKSDHLLQQLSGLLSSKHYQQALTLISGQDALVQSSPQLLLLKARLLYLNYQLSAAKDIFSHLVEAAPLDANALFNLGWELKQRLYFDLSVKAYEKALKTGISDPHEAQTNLAVSYSDGLYDMDKAEAHLLSALKTKPDYLPAIMNLGNLYEETGKIAKAQNLYEKNWKQGGGHLELLARYIGTKPKTDQMQELLARSKALLAESPVSENAALLHFALGRHYDQNRDFAKALAHFKRGNDMLRETGYHYDAEAIKSRIDALTAGPVINTEARKLRPIPVTPVFICGHFRSGSTLLEQILSSHSEINGLGENDFFTRSLFSAGAPISTHQASPLERLSAAQISEIRTAYLDHPLLLQSKAPIFLDKRPDNILRLGLIKQVFPESKFILTQRRRLDNFLSIYFTPLGPDQAYACNLDDIADYGQQIQRLSQYWQDQFQDDIITVSYENIIQDSKAEIQALMAWLGLKWDENCLEFHHSARPVKTASYHQIRQPLFRSSINRWENYAPLLPKDGLDNLT